MVAVDHHHGFVVRNNQSIKAQCIPQQVCEDAFGSSHELAIQFRVGVHHRHQSSVADGCLEGGHVYIPQVSFTQVHRTAI